MDTIIVFNESGDAIDTFHVPSKACGNVIEKIIIPARIGNIGFKYTRTKKEG